MLASSATTAFPTEEDAEVPWFEALQAYAEDRPYDPLLKGLVGLSWKQFQTKTENDWVTTRVESDGDRVRVTYKLERYLEALQEYMHAHTLFTQVLDPTANGCDGMFLERVRMDAFQSAQRVVQAKQEDYFAAHVRFWADLAAVLRSQEDIPLGDVPKLGQVAQLPVPYGQGENALVLLPLPALLEWKRDELGGGVEEQVGALMLFKSVVLPALESLKRDTSKERFLAYASVLGRIWRKAGRWFGTDPESKEFLDDIYSKARGRVATNDDPGRTGITVPGMLQVQRRGLEDVWLEKPK